MEKNKKIIGLSLGILIVLIIVVSSTYAYWQITRTQETPNDIVAACLNLDLADASAAIDLDSAWPISDEEGKNLTGYTFTVTNNCNEEINYIVGLNRVEESNYLLDSSIKLQLDDNSSHVYGELSDVEYSDAENTEYTSRVSKQVSVETIGANGTNTHTIRIWVSDEAPVTEQSKIFLGQVFITGGQGIEVPECFKISEDGVIHGYDESCGLDVKVPAEINGIKVKATTYDTFNNGDVQVHMMYDSNDEEVLVYYYNGSSKDDFIDLLKHEYCEDPETCTLADIETMGVIIITTEEEKNSIDLSSYEFIAAMIYNFNSETGEMEVSSSQVTSLDLSEAIYLEMIGQGTLTASRLEKLILPMNASLKTIGWFAFEDNNLEEIIIPSTVEIIENQAFHLNKIKSVIIPSSVKKIGYSAFEENNITSLIFEDTEEHPSQLQTVGSQAFYQNDIKKLIIPSSVTKIESSAFFSNPNLTEVIIKNTQDNVTIDNAFPSTATITYNPDYNE